MRAIEVSLLGNIINDYFILNDGGVELERFLRDGLGLSKKEFNVFMLNLMKDKNIIKVSE